MEKVLEALNNSISVVGNTVTFNRQLDGAVYDQVKRVFSAFRGEWKGGKTQAFVFPADPTPFIKHVIETGVMPKLNPHSYHPTPKIACDTIFEHTSARPDYWYGKEGHSPIQILEPSAGQGHLLDEICSRFEQAGIPIEITCIELDPLNCIVLKQKGYTPVEADFLSYMAEKDFDLIVLNPPFESLTFNAHIRHAQQMLAPKGRLVSVVPSAALRRDTLAMRQLFDDACILQDDPLTIEKGIFPTALHTECRVIELAHEDVMDRLRKIEETNAAAVSDVDLWCGNTESISTALQACSGKAKSIRQILGIISPAINELRKTNVFLNDVIQDKAVQYIAGEHDITLANRPPQTPVTANRTVKENETKQQPMDAVKTPSVNLKSDDTARIPISLIIDFSGSAQTG